MERKKKLPIGIEYFKDFRRDDFYYVDKTGLIAYTNELINTEQQFICVSRRDLTVIL